MTSFFLPLNQPAIEWDYSKASLITTWFLRCTWSWVLISKSCLINLEHSQGSMQCPIFPDVSVRVPDSEPFDGNQFSCQTTLRPYTTFEALKYWKVWARSIWINSSGFQVCGLPTLQSELEIAVFCQIWHLKSAKLVWLQSPWLSPPSLVYK